MTGWAAAIADALIQVVGAVVARVAGVLAERALRRRDVDGRPPAGGRGGPSCGDAPIDLHRQRLFMTGAFGGYFAGLLESPDIYVQVPGQLACPTAGRLDPLEWTQGTLTAPNGARVVVIAAAGGMGKSTLAARIARCLHQTEAIDLIIGDSAKRTDVDPASGQVRRVERGFADPGSLYRRLAAQTGLTGYPANVRWRTLAADLRARLAGQRALLVVDDLDGVRRHDQLLRSLAGLVGWNVRALITTRSMSALEGHVVVLNLRPLESKDLAAARAFVGWHIDRYQAVNPALASLRESALRPDRQSSLVERTGGVPLVLQVALSTIAVERWGYLDRLPAVLPPRLLAFLYGDAWGWLEASGPAGRLAHRLLRFVAIGQESTKRISAQDLRQQAILRGEEPLFGDAMRMLAQRFLLIDREPTSALGRFALTPSLRDFVLSRG
jgi:hypothetical protein